MDDVVKTVEKSVEKAVKSWWKRRGKSCGKGEKMGFRLSFGCKSGKNPRGFEWISKKISTYMDKKNFPISYLEHYWISTIST